MILNLLKLFKDFGEVTSNTILEPQYAQKMSEFPNSFKLKTNKTTAPSLLFIGVSYRRNEFEMKVLLITCFTLSCIPLIEYYQTLFYFHFPIVFYDIHISVWTSKFQKTHLIPSL